MTEKKPIAYFVGTLPPSDLRLLLVNIGQEGYEARSATKLADIANPQAASLIISKDPLDVPGVEVKSLRAWNKEHGHAASVAGSL